MPTKYDTNPLDPEFPEKAKAAAEGQHTNTLPYSGGATQTFPYVAPTAEQPTRRFAEPDVSAYSATYAPPYDGQYVPANYQTVSFGNVDSSSTRKVAKIGLPENVLTAAAYFPFMLGGIADLIMLLIAPRSEAKVRFHAAQGLAAHIAILAISMFLGVLANFTNFARVGNQLFFLATTVMLVIFAIKAWKGRPVHIESIDDLTN